MNREKNSHGLLLVACVFAAVPGGPVHAQTVLPEQQVSATRTPQAVMETPAAVSVISGETLRARGATDLRTALAGVAGVEISPGGEAGPAGAVPAFWGLREFDAFLLVVDDVPWGGAFNPALTSLDLHNVERIEVMRGAAPVMYGATSFVGVIHVIHYPAGQAERQLHAAVGGVDDRFGSVSLAGSQVLPALGAWQQSLSADVEKQVYADDEAGLKRGHLAWRTAGAMLGGQTGVDVDLHLLRQQPLSPVPRAGNGLDPTVDTDANFNPSDAKLDENRFQINARHQRDIGLGRWSTLLSLAHTQGDVVRGFITETCEGGTQPADYGDNACGFVQERKLTDLYFDTHLASSLTPRLQLVWGVDALLGKGEQESEIFTYTVDPQHGGDAPSSGRVDILKGNELEDERTFLGAYAQSEWQALPSLRVFAGLRLNRTEEKREGEAEDEQGVDMPADDERQQTRWSGTVGLNWTAWSAGADAVALYADYRSSYKPAAIDFGPEAEAEILEPETARSVEAGVKTRMLDGRLALDVSAFYMNMQNLVVPQDLGLVNAGTLFFKGGEAELRCQLTDAWNLYGAYARHDLRFGDYLRDFDGASTQLRGNFQELAPQNTGSLGVVYAPAQGLQLAANWAYTGHRYLNQRNTSKADAYTVVDAMLGYRFPHWGLRLVGTNLGDARDPVSESELGDAQYYRMPARTLALAVDVDL